MSVHARTLSEALYHLKGMAVARPSSSNKAPGDWQASKDSVTGLYSVSIRMEMFPLEIHLTRLKQRQYNFLKVAYETNVETLFVHLVSVHQARRTMEQLQRDIKQEMVRWYGRKRSEIIDQTHQLDERRKALSKLPAEKKVIKTMSSYENWRVARHEFDLSMVKAFPGYEGCRDWRDYQAKTYAFREDQEAPQRPTAMSMGS